MDAPLLLAYETVDDAIAAARVLQGLGAPARKLLAECTEHQGVTRTKLSRAADQLSDAGFVFLTESLDLFKPEWSIRPSLAGEEALEMLEQLDAAAKTKKH